jgi:predicted O-methyltransferase YrrM
MAPLVPPLVASATDRARSAGFGGSCHPAVGTLLAILAAHLRPRARVLELGTGAGVGTGWIVCGVLPRTDVQVVTVERDPRLARIAAEQDWPAFVDLRVADALTELAVLGTFDLIFADAPAGKWYGLERTISALNPDGLLVVDDMTPAAWMTAEYRRRQAEVRRQLLTCAALTSVEMRHGSGVMLSVRRGPAAGWQPRG